LSNEASQIEHKSIMKGGRGGGGGETDGGRKKRLWEFKVV